MEIFKFITASGAEVKIEDQDPVSLQPTLSVTRADGQGSYHFAIPQMQLEAMIMQVKNYDKNRMKKAAVARDSIEKCLS